LKVIITISLLFISAVLFAQSKAIPRDTSFTIYSSLIKEQKKRPYIEVANPEKPKNVIFKADIPYRDINGRVLALDIFYPKKTKKKKPAVLMIFGGGWRSGSKGAYKFVADALTSGGADASEKVREASQAIARIVRS